MYEGIKIAVVIPCYNEAKTIGKVVRDFISELPQAEIFVFDNNSSDDSAGLAQAAGAEVITIKKQGKGYVVRRMFEMVDADLYVLVDGDDTYFAQDVHKLIKPVIDDDCDMAIGRRSVAREKAMKKLNKLGNILFSDLLTLCFGRKIQDVLSGYRVMNRPLIQSIPVLTHEFQVEMELTIQTLYRGMRIIEVPVNYQERPSGSISKLHPIKDGTLILLTLLAYIRDLMPLRFFGSISLILMAAVVSYGSFVYFIARQATLLDIVIIISFTIIAWLFVAMGLFLHAINRRFIEVTTIMMRKNSG